MSKSHFRPLRLHDHIPFGKYQALRLQDVIDCDVKYVTWLITETETALQHGAHSYYIHRLNNRGE